jgi:hypothetical protein
MKRVGFLRPRDGISITHIGDNPVLFDSQKQHLYAVDELTARAWRRVCAEPTGISCHELAGFLAGSPELEGRPPSELIEAWLNIGIFGSYESPRDLIALAIGYEVCQVNCPAELGLEVRKLFRNLITNLPNAGNYTSVSIDNDELGFSLTRNKTFRGSYSASEIIVAIKAALTATLLQGEFLMALHAAALYAGKGQMLLSGTPGAGKTTLSLALAASSRYVAAGDDIALLYAGGFASGVPFPSAVKDGSWELLSPFYPKLHSEPRHIRPDGQKIVYLPCEAPRPGRVPVRYLVFLRRDGTGRAALRALPALTAFKELLASADAPKQMLSEAAFGALACLANNASAYELRYSDLHDATAALKQLP